MSVQSKGCVRAKARVVGSRKSLVAIAAALLLNQGGSWDLKEGVPRQIELLRCSRLCYLIKYTK